MLRMLRREVHTRAVVIAWRGAGEGSARVLLYTEELGLVRAVVKSAREERSKLRPYLIPGTRGHYSLVKGQAEWRITGVGGAHTTYYECASDNARMSAERVLSLVRQFVQGEGKDEELFAALYEFLESLSALDQEDIQIAEYVAVLRVLAALGYVAKGDAAAFMSAEYTAALIVRARQERKNLVSLINRGISASGL